MSPASPHPEARHAAQHDTHESGGEHPEGRQRPAPGNGAGGDEGGLPGEGDADRFDVHEQRDRHIAVSRQELAEGAGHSRGKASGRGERECGHLPRSSGHHYVIGVSFSSAASYYYAYYATHTGRGVRHARM